jgi:regulatory protein
VPPRRRKAPKKITPQYLQRLAGWYLERWEATADSLRRTLMKRVYRAVEAHDQDLEECTEMAEAVVAEMVRSGMVDDLRYTQNVVRRGRERGASAMKLRAKLRAKGVDARLVDEVLAEERDDEGPSPERIAAIRYARRRRFGPWRRPDPRPDAERKELASMARAGFPYGLCRDILDADDAWALEDELPRGW